MSGPSHQFEINPDLRTETINITFDDIDKEITGKFQTFGSGVRCEFFLYYPDVDLTVSTWFGQLQAPKNYGWKQLKTQATNGFRSREQQIPKRMRPRECTSNFGGRLPTTDAVKTNLCPYDRHLGGIFGLLNGAVPFTDCPRMTEADCTTRFGHALFYGGFNTDATATVSDGRTGYLARSQGNASRLKEPIRAVAGTKHVRGLMPLLWRREVNQSNPDHGWIAAIWEVCDGSVRNVRNFKVNETAIAQMHLDYRFGYRGQPAVTGYNGSAGVSNFSKTTHVMARYGWVNAALTAIGDLSAECDVDGYAEVAVFNDTAAGNGIVGEYYSNDSFSGVPAGVRVDYNINFPTQQGQPFDGIPVDGFSVIWTGEIKPRYSQTYTFTGDHDNGMKLVINGVTIFDEAAVGVHSGMIALTADTLYTIEIRFKNIFINNINPWRCILKWQSASQALEVVPNERLFHPGTTGFVRQWTNDRIWWLGELYTNQGFGAAYPIDRLDIDYWVAASQWGLQTVNFQHTFPDGEVRNFAHRRTTFDAIIEGRPVAEQVEDICTAGRITVPFQHDGKFIIRPFRAATAGELTNAREFTDVGDNVNIIWDDGQPSISVGWTPNDKLINDITLTFEDSTNSDTERPITVDDPNQKLKAGRALGEDNLQSVPKKFAAFGSRAINEVVKLAYGLLRFGQHDEGGIENNLRITFTVPFEQALGLLRYDIIKVTSALITGFLSPQAEQFEYFRVLKLEKADNHTAKITAQAYNHTAYTAFETVTVPNPEPPGPNIPSPGPGPTNPPCSPTLTAIFNPDTGTLEVNIIPC